VSGSRRLEVSVAWNTGVLSSGSGEPNMARR
jgi:hypothetical protein